jgi:serine/threonine protein kinase
MTSHDCPSEERLRAFDRGEVPRDELDAIAAHLGRCAKCIERLVGLAAPVGEFPDVPAEVPADGEYLRAVALIAARPRLPEVGDTLRDYRLVENIGRGGMGTVFKAVHTKLDKVVAVKVLSGRRWHAPEAAVRFEREMKAVGRLDHPNIVKASDAGDADGVPYLVMEFVDGETLSALVRRGGPLPLSTACALVCQAAAGLGHAHRAGVVHRDVKPSNLMLTHAGEVKVLDLGLALPLAPTAETDTVAGDITGSGSDRGSDLTSPSRTVGTVDYMAPEQKRDAHAVDARADVYGLGCTLWFLLTGRPPRPGDRLDAGALPAAFWERILAPDPADRFPTMEAVVAALDRTLAPRRLRVWLLPTLAVFALAGVATTLLAFGRDARPTIVGPPSEPPRESSGPEAGRLPLTDEQAAELQGRWAAHRGIPVRTEGPDGLTFALIPPGEFMLSSQCRVRITKPFRLATCEVTRDQFRRFVEAKNYRTSAVSTGKGGFILKPNFKPTGGRPEILSNPELNWANSGHKVIAPDQPVCVVSWDDAQAYCRWLGERDGRIYRLPTEAELTWAIRCGNPSDETIPPKSELALEIGWHRWNCDQPQPVGKRKANAWGLFDTYGNVAEWCEDRAGPLPAGEFNDFAGTTDPTRPRRVFTGYSYLTPAFKHQPLRDNALSDQSFAHVGFRILCEVP